MTTQFHSLPPAGWYADPHGAGRRYWNGQAWTADVLPHAPVAPPPPVVAPALGLTWTGYRGGKALRAGEACHVSGTSERLSAKGAAVSTHASDDAYERFRDSLTKEY